jgi:hypothetical protein
VTEFLEEKSADTNHLGTQNGGTLDDQSGIRTRKKRLHQEVAADQTIPTQKLIEDDMIPTYWQEAIANEIPIPGKKVKLSVEECSSRLVTVDKATHQATQTGACYQFCVERATALLNLGHHIVVVDKTPQPQPQHSKNEEEVITMTTKTSLVMKEEEEKIPNLGHRAQLISSIIRSNIGTIDYFNATSSSSKSKKKKNTPVSRWGPILIITKIKDLLTWEEILRKECEIPVLVTTETSRPLRVLSYYGNTTDRALLRSYLTSSSLYTERSPCHIVLTHYEALLTDIYYFKLIRWQMVILDEGWSIVSNLKNKHLLDEINSLQTRHKIISCSSLSASSSSPSGSKSPVVQQYPDIYLTIQFLFPSLWQALDSQNENFLVTQQANGGNTSSLNSNGNGNIEFVTKRLLQHLCSSLTAICDEEISNLVHSQSLDTDDDTIKYYEVVENLPWFEWEGVHVQVQANPKVRSSSNPSQGKYRVTYEFTKIENTSHFDDVDITNEFNSIKIDNLGKLAEMSLKKLKQKNKPSSSLENDSVVTTGPGKKKAKKGGGAAGQIAFSSTGGTVTGGGGGDGTNGETVHDRDDMDTSQMRNEMTKANNEEGELETFEDSMEKGDPLSEGQASSQRETLIDAPTSDDLLFGKQAPPKAIKRKGTSVTSTTTPSSKPKPAVIRHFEPEDELLRSVAMRGDRWQVSLSFPGRVRFLGLYRTEEAVMKAYVIGLLQRRVLLTEGLTHLPRIKFVGDAIGTHPSLAPPPLLSPLSGGFEGSLAMSLGKKRRIYEIYNEQEMLERSSDDR